MDGRVDLLLGKLLLQFGTKLPDLLGQLFAKLRSFIPRGFDDDQLHPGAGASLADQVRHPVGLPKSQPASPRPQSDGHPAEPRSDFARIPPSTHNFSCARNTSSARWIDPSDSGNTSLRFANSSRSNQTAWG